MTGRTTHSARRTVVTAVTAVLALLIGLVVAAPSATAAGEPRIDLRVLVLTDGSEWVGAIAAELDSAGVPSTQVDLRSGTRPAITAAYLSDTVASVPRAKFQAVVLPNEAPTQLTAAELTALHTYEAAFGVRQVDASTWAHPGVGLNYAENPGYVGTLDGITATATTAGKAEAFKSLDGPVGFENLDPAVLESDGFIARPLPDNAAAGTSYRMLVSAPMPGVTEQGSLVGVYTHEGREELVITFTYNVYQQQFQWIASGIISWMTRGIHLGYERNYFSVQVDDVFLEDLRWSSTANCTPGDVCPPGTPMNEPIKMTPTDVDVLKTWQTTNGMPLDLAFNAEGAVPSDPLTTSLLTNKASFRWLNHTWSHLYLGCVQDFSVIPWVCQTAGGQIQYEPQTVLNNEIGQNQTWATTNAVTIDPGELVTGEHSGLKSSPQMAVDNPNLAPALTARGIDYVASDASREPAQRAIGSTLTVPRYPMNIFYNVAKAAEEVDEYNWIYTSRANGGSGICEDNPATSTCITPLDVNTGFASYIVPIEIQNATRHLLGNDPRPHYAHQSNITEDRILYPVLDGVLSRYDTAFANNAPLLHPTTRESGVLLRQADLWKTARNSVTAYVVGNTVTVQNTGSAATVPVTMPEGTLTLTSGGTTGPAFGTAYAGERSSQVAFAASQTQSYRLTAGFPVTPTAPDAPAIGTATAGNGTATVAWTAPAYNGGSAITGYQVRVYRNGALVSTQTAAAGATSLAITGLTNGSPHQFSVAAVNAIGTGAFSVLSNTVTPSAPAGPGVPGIGTATAGNATATAVWTAPASNGGSAITSYKVRVYRGTTLINTLNAGATATSLVMTGLINGQPHQFSVAAVNVLGTSAFSALSNTVTPTAPTVPGVPGIGTATAGNATATAVWTAPASTGGSAITGYKVRVYRGTTLINTLNAGATATSLAMTGLINGQPHQFAFAAVNAIGTGTFSGKSNTVTPAPTGAVPGTPGIGSATAGNATATAKWTAPAGNGGSAITGYKVRVYRSGTLINTLSAGATATQLVMTGLINGTPHQFSVAAVNAIGTGAFSGLSTAVTPKGAPAAPTVGTASAGATSATIRWTLPTNNGGSAITSNLVRTYRAGTLINTKTVAATATSVVNTALIKGQPHRFTVAAVNAQGTSPYSAQSNQVIPT
ncbi:fibronectin type III domain-containing protein [Kribbella sp. DT2]|uniref:fibronectin type III domain-containing protein n=1 Tax=Kribbella sp. DT2 TaxID=3393427 RepID=UPI003CEDC7AC